MFNEEEFPGYTAVYRKIIEEGKKRAAKFVSCEDLYNERIPEERVFAQ